ncbi:hypothetical protein pb186bvf_000927 [Paramecium bursaria]
MIEIRRPLSEKNLGHRATIQSQERPKQEVQRPSSSGQKSQNMMKSSLQLQKQNQNFYSKYFSTKEKENIEIKANERPNSKQKSVRSPKEYQEYKKLQDKLQYLENKIITIKQHIDQSQKVTKQGLAAKFFSQKQNIKPKQSGIFDEPKETVIKKPSLSTFITQVKQTQMNENNNKNLLNRPDSSKSSQSINKQAFKRKNSSEQQSPNFLFYVSSIIRAYMATDITKPIGLIREHLLQTMQASQYSKTIQPTLQSIIDEKRVNLPPTNRKTIVFDLDETLIHCNENTKIPGDVILPIKFPTGEIIEASINIRPYAQQILQTLSRHYEVIVFTASHSCYANVVIDHIDPNKQWISHRLFRESCVQTEEGAYLKDLRVLGNRNLADLVLIDNAAYSFSLQLQNGIPIINFYDNKQDQELLYLQNYLMGMRTIKDMRAFNAQYLKLDRFFQFQDPIELLQTSSFPDFL